MLSCMMMTVLLLGAPSQDSADKAALQPSSVIVAQPGTPVRITSYDSAYHVDNGQQGIHHSLEYESATEREVVAVRLALVSFDIWNEPLGRIRGTTIRTLGPGTGHQCKWLERDFGTPSYAQAFGTGVAYVQSVRYGNGEVWSADDEAVRSRISKIYGRYGEWQAKWSRRFAHSAPTTRNE